MNKHGQESEIWSNWQRLKEKEKSRQLRILERVKKRKPDFSQISEIHESVFGQFDCLSCANCCKTARPTFNRTDIRRIARHMGYTEGELEKAYLQEDAQGDFVPRTMPCPFLESNNDCRIYDVRPASCRSFPHTDVRDAWNRSKHMAATAQVCPAAFAIIQRLAQISGLGIQGW